jgi:predicted DNA-binding transcriptional regulator AlpA
MADEPLLTAEEAQAHLGVSRATFWNFVKRWQVPRYQKPLTGKRLFFKASDLDAARNSARRVNGGEKRPPREALGGRATRLTSKGGA